MMKLGFFKTIGIIFSFLLIMTACSKDNSEIAISEKDIDLETKVNYTSDEQQQAETSKTETTQTSDKSPEDLEQNNIQSDEIQEEKKTKAEEPAQKPENKEKPADNQSKQQSFSKYSNKSYSWWFKKSKGQPSTIPQDIQALIDKYDGVFRKNTDEKVLYLTFDEGYENGYTPIILDILKENQVPAAFFITGPYLSKHSDLVKRMIDEGHIVGNHTINHPSMPEILDDNKLEEEILGLERNLYELFNQKMNYLRPPKGEYSERTLALTQSLGYKTVFWSFAYADWDVNNQKGADHAYEKVMDGLHNGAVILLHAVSKDNTEALDRIIKDARAQGYEFKSLDEF